MTLKTRRFIFYILTVLFVIVASIVLLYSQGYRFNIETRTIDTIGGVYVKSDPSDVVITIDSKDVKNKSGFIKSGTLISSLIPGIHEVSLNKDGYSSWNKNANVKSGIVSVFENIILVPNEKREFIASSVDKFFVERDQLLVVNDKEILFESAKIIGDEVLSFDDSGDVLSFDSEDETYYLSNAFDLTRPLNINTIFNSLKKTQLNLSGDVPIKKILPYPYNGEKFVIMTNRALYTLDTERREIEQISPTVNNFVLSNSNILWNDDDGLYSYHLVFRTDAEILLNEGVDFLNIKQFQIDTNGDFVGIVDSNNTLYLTDLELASTTKISTDTTSFIFSPDNIVLSIIENNTELSVFYLTDEEVHDKLLVDIYTFPNSIISAVWHKDNAHMFVLDESDTLYFVEIDDSKPINAPVISTGVKDFKYDASKDLLYYDNGEGIFSLEI